MEMQILRNRLPAKVNKFKMDSLQQKAFDVLPRDEQLKYLALVKQGIVPKLKVFPFLTEKEYRTDRLQYERDKHPEIYKDVPRVGYGMRKIRGKDLYKVFDKETGAVKSRCSKKEAKALLGSALPADKLKQALQSTYSTGEIEGYTLDKDLSDDRVKVYKNNTSNEVIVAHRGSKGFRDWLDNARYAYSGDIRTSGTYQEAKKKQQKAIDKYGADNIISVGHSRAGKFVEEFNKETPVKEVLTYNKAVHPNEVFQSNPENQTDVRTSTDLISGLSPLQFSKNETVTIPSGYDLLKAHKPSNLEYLGSKLIGRGKRKVKL